MGCTAVTKKHRMMLCICEQQGDVASKGQSCHYTKRRSLSEKEIPSDDQSATLPNNDDLMDLKDGRIGE